MKKYWNKIINYLLNNNLFFVEILILSLPALILKFQPNDITNLIKNILYIYFSLVSIQVLIPLIYKAFEKNSKFKLEETRKRVSFFAKTIFFSLILMATTKLLHSHLAPHLFYTLLLTLFLKILVIKAKIESYNFIKNSILKFGYFLSLNFLALLTYDDLLITPAFLIALSMTFLFMGFSLSSFYQQKPEDLNAKLLKMPGAFYLFHAGLQGIYVLLQLMASWKFMIFFFVPLISKMTPTPTSQINVENLRKYQRINLLLFVIFLGIMLI